MEKQTKILIGIPTDGNLTTEFVDSYVALIFETMRYFDYKAMVMHYFVKGVRTDKNRNQMVDKFLKEDFDYLLFLDSDMTYPRDMFIKYFESGKELIGGVYYKRTAPYHPVLYKFSGNEGTPFSTIDPLTLPADSVVAVDGLGTGGMFIRRSVFDKLEKAGQDPWFKYGDNYHLPYKTANQTTHDLVFCKKCREAGVDIFVHTGVKMGHLEHREVTEKDWMEYREQEVNGGDHVTIIIPAYGDDSTDKLYRTLESIEQNTQYNDYEVKVIVDGDPDLLAKVKEDHRQFKNTQFLYSEVNQGYGKTVNEAIMGSKGSYFVYLAQDVLVGSKWLAEALRVHKEAFPEGDGLVTFNDGKWYGEIACHGLVHRNFIKKYCGETLFYPGYKHYHVDLELTKVARREQKLAYAYNSVVYHVQAKSGKSKPDKSLEKGLSTSDVDWQLHLQREAQGFPKH